MTTARFNEKGCLHAGVGVEMLYEAYYYPAYYLKGQL
jgi:hypothetical protein